MSVQNEVPRGYILAGRQQGFSATIGPFYEKQEAVHRLRAFRVLDWHCNPEGYLHGGMLACCADYAMYQVIGDVLGETSKTPTVSLTTNYLAPARAGDWVMAQAEIVQRSSSMVFARVDIFTEQQALLTATGVYKIQR